MADLTTFSSLPRLVKGITEILFKWDPELLDLLVSGTNSHLIPVSFPSECFVSSINSLNWDITVYVGPFSYLTTGVSLNRIRLYLDSLKEFMFFQWKRDTTYPMDVKYGGVCSLLLTRIISEIPFADVFRGFLV